jgi:hypothetical protein
VITTTIISLAVYTTGVFATIIAVPGEFKFLSGRQKFVALRAFYTDGTNVVALENVTPNPFTLTNLQGCTVTGTAPNICVIPNSSAGKISFNVSYAGESAEADITFTSESQDVYTAPYAIKAPDFGILETHNIYNQATYNYDYGSGPEHYRHSSDGPYTHYVDLVNGNDANGLGSPSAPRKTIPTGIQAGSVIEIHGASTTDCGGTNCPQIEFSIVGGGNSSLPVYIRGANAANKPIVKQGLHIRSNYVIIENIDFDCSNPCEGCAPGNCSSDPEPADCHTTNAWILVDEKPITDGWETYHHVAVRHCLFRDYPAGVAGGVVAVGFMINHNSDSPNDSTHLIENCVVYDIEVRNFGNWLNTQSSADFFGVGFASNTRYMWCLDSNLHHIEGDGAVASRNNSESEPYPKPNQAPARDVYFGRNTIHSVKENCIDLKFANKAIISQNAAYTVRTSASSTGSAFNVLNNDANSNWPYSDNIWFVYNDIYDMQQGIVVTFNKFGSPPTFPTGAPARVYSIWNMFKYCRTYGATNLGYGMHIGDMTQVTVLNSTFYNCEVGVQVACNNSGLPDSYSQTTVKNCLFSHMLNETSYYSGVSTCTWAKLSYLDYSGHYQNMLFRINEAPNDPFSTIASLQSNTLYGDHSLTGDPKFTNLSNWDFRLEGTSPYRNAGILDNAIAEFQNVFGGAFPSIDHDFYGKTWTSNDKTIGATMRR